MEIVKWGFTDQNSILCGTWLRVISPLTVSATLCWRLWGCNCNNSSLTPIHEFLDDRWNLLWCFVHLCFVLRIKDRGILCLLYCLEILVLTFPWKQSSSSPMNYEEQDSINAPWHTHCVFDMQPTKPGQFLLIGIAVAYMSLIVIIPFLNVFVQVFAFLWLTRVLIIRHSYHWSCSITRQDYGVTCKLSSETTCFYCK